MMRKADRLYTAVALVSGVLVMSALFSVPAWGQNSKLARVGLVAEDPANASRVGDVLLRLSDDGTTVSVIGLDRAVPGGSTIVASRLLVSHMRTASNRGLFPSPTEGSITFPLQIVQGQTVQVRITDPKTPATPFNASFVVDFTKFTENPHKLITIVPDDPVAAQAAGITFGQVVLTQKKDPADGVVKDYFEGLPGAVPALAKIEVFNRPRSQVASDTAWLNYRVFSTTSAKRYGTQYVSDGNIFPWRIANLHSGRPTILREDTTTTPPSMVTLYPESKLYLRITTQQRGTFYATIQDDVTATIDPSLLVFTNNNQKNPDGTFPLAASVVARATGPAGTAEAFSSVIATQVIDGNTVTVGSADVDSTGAMALLRIRQAISNNIYIPLDLATLRVEDRFGNVQSNIPFDNPDTEVVVFEAPTVTGTDTDPAFTGHIQGAVEPSTIVVVRADMVDAYTAGGPFWLGTTFASAVDGSFIFDVTRSPTVDITLIDPAGNRRVLDKLNIDVVAQPAVVTKTGIKVGYPTTTISGTAEPNSGIRIIGLSSVTSAILDGLVTGQVVASLPAGVGNGVIAQTSSNASGNFTATISGIASQVVYVQVVDRAGNYSQYTAVVLSRAVAGESLVSFTNLKFTFNGTTVPSRLNLTVEDAENPGTPMPNVLVYAFAEKADGLLFRYPITDVDFPPISQADGTLDYSLEIPTFLPDATVFNSSTLISEFYLVARDMFTGGFIGARKITAADGFDRVGPEISTVIPLIFTDDDLQLIQYGTEAPDVLNVLNIFPNFAPAGPRLPADALNLIFIIADDNDDEQIDVWDVNNLQIVNWKPLDAVVAASYGNLIGLNLPPGYSVPIPGATGLNLGYNFWNPRTQVSAGHRVVFVALMDQMGNWSPDPVPVVLDVDTQDPDPDFITIGDGVVIGADGAVEPQSNIAIYGDTTLTDLLGVTEANDVGAFSVVADTARDAIVVFTRDQAGNRSNPVNVKAAPVVAGVPYLILDGYGMLHAPGGTIVGSAASQGTARALAKALDAPGAYYQLDAYGEVAGPVGSVGGASIDAGDQIILSRKLARDLEITAAAGGKVSGYVLTGNGFVGTYGDAPFFGDAVRDSLAAANTRVTGANERVRLEGSIFLEDSNGNGEYDIFVFTTEDKNGNGVLDPETIEFVWDEETQSMQEITIPSEDENGNGVLDAVFDAEGLFDASEIGNGFRNDVARDLEVVYAESDGVASAVGYMILDAWGVLHHYGTVPNLQNPRVSPGYSIFRAFKLITDADGVVQDFVILNGLGQMYATPGGFLGAPAEDPETPGGGGDLSFVLNPQPVFFGFDIARDVEINPVDSNEDGVVGDGGDGFYVLDGYGGIHAVGNAPAVQNAPFLGFDIARDLEISPTGSGAIPVPSQ
ncbi:MAG: hypothetical protein ABIH23_23325 [bacterium]